MFLPFKCQTFRHHSRKSTSASNDIINGWIPFSCSSVRARVVLARACHFSSLALPSYLADSLGRHEENPGVWELEGGVRSSGGLMGVYSLRRHQQMDLCRRWSGPIITDILQLQPTVCSLTARDAYINQHDMFEIFLSADVMCPPQSHCNTKKEITWRRCVCKSLSKIAFSSSYCLAQMSGGGTPAGYSSISYTQPATLCWKSILHCVFSGLFDWLSAVVYIFYIFWI